MKINLNRLQWGYLLSMLLSGAIMTLCFAPFHAWWLAPFILAWVFALIQSSQPRQAFWLAWSFGFGLMITGASWVYVAIHEFGQTPALIALVLTILFAAVLALFYGFGFAIYRYLIPQVSIWAPYSFAACWTLVEFARSYLFTGFPWLLVGNAVIQSPLTGLAPIFGIYSLTFVIALSGALIYQILVYKKIYSAIILLIGWLICALLPATLLPIVMKPVTVALVQGNIQQSLKWSYLGQQHAIDTYLRLTQEYAQNADLIIWPETALPMLEQDALPYFLAAQTDHHNSALISGILSQHDQGIYNAVVALTRHANGNIQLSHYFKSHLVPFGEYVPFYHWIARFFNFLHIPVPDLASGPRQQAPLVIKQLRIGTAVCYEIVYNDLVRLRAQHANVLLTLSNDSWFGHSLGPAQHLQIAQMRALENGRYLIRATSNGITAIIGPNGQILAQLPQFTAAVLAGKIVPINQQTWFTYWGNWPIFVLVILMFFGDPALLNRLWRR